jgi:hypothetical protein
MHTYGLPSLPSVSSLFPTSTILSESFFYEPLDGTVNITGVTFHGNRGGNGGAVLNDGTMVIANSTFFENASERV